MRLGPVEQWNAAVNKRPRMPVKDSDEAPLIAAAGRGDREAQRALFERYRDAAFAAAARITGRREDALDVVQDAFIKAFDSLRRFQGEAGFKTWLLRIVSNRALDLLRSRRVRLAAPLDGEPDRAAPAPPARDDGGPGGDLERHELAARLTQAVEALPPDQRAVFALFATGEMSYGEIADVLGIPIGTVMSRLFHARLKLKERLADLAPGELTRERA